MIGRLLVVNVTVLCVCLGSRHSATKAYRHREAHWDAMWLLVTRCAALEKATTTGLGERLNLARLLKKLQFVRLGPQLLLISAQICCYRNNLVPCDYSVQSMSEDMSKSFRCVCPVAGGGLRGSSGARAPRPADIPLR